MKHDGDGDLLTYILTAHGLNFEHSELFNIICHKPASLVRPQVQVAAY